MTGSPHGLNGEARRWVTTGFQRRRAGTEIVRLSVEEYEAIRGTPTDFLNVPGHEVAAGPYGELVERNHRYVVVRKKGAAAEIVKDLDPRTAA
jgi:hypothetical protein